MNALADIGLIGLAVMGENLVLNMESKGFTVAVFNRSVDKVDKFIEGRGKGKKFYGAHSIEELIQAVKKPRKIMMLVKAGQPVDDLIEQLLPYLGPGDIVIDGGNSYFPDTIRRTKYIEDKGLLYVGTGVSGGEEGALTGPSIMPGGSLKAWAQVKPLFQAISAKVEDGTPCCDWVGENGAGHFVKMVHNGIEYGDMQLICEAYHMLRDMGGFSSDEMHGIFSSWNQGELNSYLIEITADILGYKDGNGDALVEKILDTAGQKGTGKWTGIEALELGVPLTLIVEAVFARSLSSFKEERVKAAEILNIPPVRFTGDRQALVDDLRNALYASKIVSYAQGFALMKTAAIDYKWNLNYGGIALMWRGGCIIRSAVLEKIKEAFVRIRIFKIYCSIPISRAGLRKPREGGGVLLPQRRCMAFLFPHFHRLWPILMVTGQHVFRPTFYRRNVITLVPTRMNVLTGQGESSFIQTGLVAVAKQPHLHIMHNGLKIESSLFLSIFA